MKYLLIFCFCFSFTAKAQRNIADSVITKTALSNTVKFLSHDSLQGRFTGSKGANTAAQFIIGQYKSTGLVPVEKYSDYIDSFPVGTKRHPVSGFNIVGALPGKITNDSIVIFSAHYDHVGRGYDLPYNKDFDSGDDIFNGANDNASGTAALLELAKYYAAAKNNRYLLLFIAFSGEELGLIGSTHFAKTIDAGKIKTVINMDMLGRSPNEKCYVFTLGRDKFKKPLNKQLMTMDSSIRENFFTGDPYPEEKLGSRSDHYPFALKKINAFSISSSAGDDIYYHTNKDEYDTIDFDFLLSATKNIALACSIFTN